MKPAPANTPTQNDILHVARSASIATVQRYGGAIEDYLGEAFIAATAAAKRFKPERGFKFATFAVLNVTKHISDKLLDERGYRRHMDKGVRGRLATPQGGAGQLHDGIRAKAPGNSKEDAAEVIKRTRFRTRAWEYQRMRAAGLQQNHMATALGLSATMVGNDIASLNRAMREAVA